MQYNKLHKKTLTILQDSFDRIALFSANFNREISSDVYPIVAWAKLAPSRE